MGRLHRPERSLEALPARLPALRGDAPRGRRRRRLVGAAQARDQGQRPHAHDGQELGPDRPAHPALDDRQGADAVRTPGRRRRWPSGTLIAAMRIARVAEDEFHDWYDTEHLPERQRVPGFLACERWLGAEDPLVSVATYDLDSVAVLQGGAYRAIGGENLSPWSKRVTARVDRLMRFEGDQILPG